MLRDARLLALGALLALGCGDDAAPAEEPDMATADTGTPDAGPPDLGPEIAPICEELGLTPMAFQAGTGDLFGDVAGDFRVTELDGSRWSFEENFTGCENMVFLTYFPGLEASDELWPSEIILDPFIETPLNTHYFFITNIGTEGARVGRLRSVERSLTTSLDFLNIQGEARERQLARFHLVADQLESVEGSVGQFARSYLAYMESPAARVNIGDRNGDGEDDFTGAPLPFAFGIDRDQRWDPVGSLSTRVGGPQALRMASFAADFYDAKAAMRERVASEDAAGARVVPLVDEDVTERVFTRTVTLPDLAGQDTMTFDVSVTCPFRSPFACSEWDRIARIEVCLDGSTCEERREVIRWITPYWRRGNRRWLVDASPFMGLVAAQGTEVTFRVEMGPTWERATERRVTMSLRFTASGGERSAGAERLFTGGRFDASYAENHPDVSFTVPAGATRVELVTILSGHGQDGSTNCAEWCDHRHTFTIDGSPLETIRHDGGIFVPTGCAERSGEGIPPGQWGNWPQSRAYWCPGLPVDAIRQDITSLVTPGVESTVSYDASFAGRPPPAEHNANISLNTYVVWYE
ncbi:MAG: peptide-N-glycosidase F-related protein [Myxococcota bacterium]